MRPTWDCQFPVFELLLKILTSGAHFHGFGGACLSAARAPRGKARRGPNSLAFRATSQPQIAFAGHNNLVPGEIQITTFRSSDRAPVCA